MPCFSKKRKRDIVTLMKKTTKQTRNSHPLFDYLGWTGVFLLLLSYILLSSEIILGASYIYQLMALAGSLCIALEAWHKKDRQPAVLNFIFAVIAVLAIGRLALLY